MKIVTEEMKNEMRKIIKSINWKHEWDSLTKKQQDDFLILFGPRKKPYENEEIIKLYNIFRNARNSE